jgi:pyruvate/2-oxoglutarate dehydrogenase complex dihydrolipoamide dehydrogenase (E3) component
MRAHDYKQRVCMVERSSVVGGTGLWNGALASKTMWEVAEQYITYRRVALNLSRTRQRAADFTPLHIAQVHRIVQVRTIARSKGVDVFPNHAWCVGRRRARTRLIRCRRSWMCSAFL